MPKIFVKGCDKTKENDTRIMLERALRDGLESPDTEWIKDQTIYALNGFSTDEYFKMIDKIQAGEFGGEEEITAMHRLEKLELAMTLSRNLLNKDVVKFKWKAS